jgi:hypothetical protein
VLTEFTAWMDAYQLVYADADNVRTTPCPHCAWTSLNLAYVVPEDTADSGTAVFWCAHCLFGLMPFQAPVPLAAAKTLAGTEQIPNYTVVVDDSQPIE